MSAENNWDESYQQNSDTKLLIVRLSLNNPLDQSTILKLPAVYRRSTTRNQIELPEGQLVY